MLQNDKYSVINIRKYLESDNPKLGEDDLVQILSEFSCERNSDVERFLKNRFYNFYIAGEWDEISLPSQYKIWCESNNIGLYSDDVNKLTLK